jgi:hypothetical protein
VKVEEGHTISWSVQPHKKSMYEFSAESQYSTDNLPEILGYSSTREQAMPERLEELRSIRLSKMPLLLYNTSTQGLTREDGLRLRGTMLLQLKSSSKRRVLYLYTGMGNARRTKYLWGRMR